MNEWKERAEKAEAALADLRSRCSASVLECIYQFPNVGEYVAQMERELAEARGLLTDCVRLLSYPREAYDAGEVLLGRNNAERFLAARPAPAGCEHQPDPTETFCVRCGRRDWTAAGRADPRPVGAAVGMPKDGIDDPRIYKGADPRPAPRLKLNLPEDWNAHTPDGYNPAEPRADSRPARAECDSCEELSRGLRILLSATEELDADGPEEYYSAMESARNAIGNYEKRKHRLTKER